MNIIEIKELSHMFSDGTLVLDNIDFSVKRGEFIVIAGRNGSGKTTLLRHLNGLLFPTGGTVLVDGVSVSEDPVRARRVVGMVFQDSDTQIIGETVREDVAFGPENLCLDRNEIEQRISDALKITGLISLADARPHLLSGGEKRRLAIAGVLAMKPEVLAFDEPFSNLDYPGTRQVLKQIIELHASGRTIIITTHDLEKVIAHADRLIIMKDGKIARTGSPEQIISDTEMFGIKEPYFSRMGLGMISWLS
ncbi:MAG: energy-coupling factor ABC transporter ATP-binding protein [Proteobacteria bacterium]|nr:energy-coupling factor ABC transporter ATP-binding protein [Pseudomonadota bacterium]